jgi:ABC-2 type transport system permease protein
MSALRVFTLGGISSYRALFNWRHPAVYLPTVLAYPVFQMLFFAFLGRFNSIGDDRYFVVGNAIQASAIAGIYGMVMCLANEREFGTLSSILATPANRFALFCGRTVPVIANGLIAAGFALGAGVVLLRVRIPVAALPALVATVALTAVSCALFGLALGSVALRAKDLWVGSNLAYNLMLLLCGAYVPLAAMPGWVGAVGRALPLTHGIEAARRLTTGASLVEVAGLLGREAAIAVSYAVIGYLLLRIFEAENRRRGSLDTQ